MKLINKLVPKCTLRFQKTMQGGLPAQVQNGFLVAWRTCPQVWSRSDTRGGGPSQPRPGTDQTPAPRSPVRDYPVKIATQDRIMSSKKILLAIKIILTKSLNFVIMYVQNTRSRELKRLEIIQTILMKAIFKSELLVYKTLSTYLYMLV